ncbi:hypothetical protein AB1Y20_023343 [Prymnesium parvum]|uniref:Secreted protein n=1 Tax=Prymnesium parvum TaxID=97485 RepID=A0AB34JDL4_PRYPA
MVALVAARVAAMVAVLWVVAAREKAAVEVVVVTKGEVVEMAAAGSEEAMAAVMWVDPMAEEVKVEAVWEVEPEGATEEVR